MKTYLLRNATVVNEGEINQRDVLIEGPFISITAPAGTVSESKAETVIDATGLHLLPGCIDDQVHFREPGLTHKGDLYTESRAAVAGGITSYMEMPNTVPNALTRELLEWKYQRASEVSLANYSFFMGASNDNVAEVAAIDPRNVCGVKIFMGSSTGNMLVDDQRALDDLFKYAPTIIATHCEDEQTIRDNMAAYEQRYGDDILPQHHPLIRSAEACYRSSSRAADLREKHNARLHILHISTARELELFDAHSPLEQKRLTSEACIHHLWFSDEDYATRGNFIKWNPAIKTAADRAAIRQAIIENRIDVVATDHAPHTVEEKLQRYTKAPSGGPLVQHALPAMLELCRQGVYTLELVVHKMSHAVATLFQIEKRGFIREGYYADLVLVNLNDPWQVEKGNLLYKCKWSPFEGQKFSARIIKTFVSGHLAYDNGRFDESQRGLRLQFDR